MLLRLSWQRHRLKTWRTNDMFSKTDRTLIKMLFERGTVDEIDGKLPD